jgi:hypothetical protein
MKVWNAVGVMALAFGISTHAQAFGLGGLVGGDNKSSGGGNVEQQIDDFLKTADQAHGLTTKSEEILAGALLTKDETDKLKADMEAAQAVADPKEKEAAVSKVEADRQAALAKVDYPKKAKEMEKANDKKKQAQVGASIYNFILGLLKDKELVDKGSSLASSALSNPTLITKLGKVKDVIGSISGQMDNMTKIAGGLQKLASVAKVGNLPTKTTDTPKEIAD